MEFQEFWKQKERMCDSHRRKGLCSEKCGLSSRNTNVGKPCDIFILDNTQKAEAIVQKWASEHPLKTNYDKFKEVFGYEAIHLLSPNNWWNQEYIPPESVKE